MGSLAQAIAVVGLVALAAVPGRGLAEDRMEKSTPFPASSLAVQDLSGQLVVEIEDRKDILLVLRGPKARVLAVRADVRGKTLTVEGGGGNDGLSVVRANNVTTVVSGGGSATVTIGGRDASVNVPAQPPLHVVARVPKGTPVTVERAVDSVSIGDTGAPLRLGVSSASAVVGRVGASELRVEGSGDIRVRRVEGDLGIVIEGSGDVKVDEGEIGNLTVAIEGNGDIGVGGRAQDADISLSGAGDIHVREVVRRPKVTISGAGDVKIGNW